MTRTRAAVLRAPDKPFVIEDVVLGELRPDEVLVRIVGTGMCHTDLLPRPPSS
jgi:aryl-alcohol dehydrogenase